MNDPLADQTVPTRRQALRLARLMGCSGAHEVPGGGWLPCESRDAMNDLIRNGKKSANVTRTLIDCGCGCKGAGDCKDGYPNDQRRPKRKPPKRIYTGRGVALDVDVRGPSSFAGLTPAAKGYDRFARDGDLDGLVQDGTPNQRRARTLAHRKIGKKPPKRVVLAARLRDLPVPFAEGVEEQAPPT